MVQDNKSKNKTYVNNKPLEIGKAVDLKNKDKLTLGNYKLEVRIEEEVEEEFKFENEK